MVRQQHDSELEMELIPRQVSIGIDSSSMASSTTNSTTSSKSSLHFMKSSVTVWFIPLIFALATFYMYILSTNAPPLKDDSDRATLRFPRSIEALKNLSNTLQHYRDDHLAYLLLLYGSTYLYKQSFSLPGSAILNLLGGALFGTWLGFPFCCLLTAVGATLCYLLVSHFAHNLVVECCHKKISILQKKVEAGRDNLFFVLLFMRMVPMSPNSLITITCPLLNVPKKIFFFSILFGMAPYTFISVQTGSFLSQLNSFDDLFSLRTFLTLGLIATVAGCTGLVITRKKDRIDKLPPGAYPTHAGDPSLSRTIKPSLPLDGAASDYDIESLNNYNVREQTDARGQQLYPNRNGGLYGDGFQNSSPSTMNTSSAAYKDAPTGSLMNNTINYPSNINPNPPPINLAKSSLPLVSTSLNNTGTGLNPTNIPTNNPITSFSGFPPAMNPNQPAPAPTNNPLSAIGSFPPGMNPNQPAPAPANNPTTSFSGFPPAMNLNQSAPAPTNNPSSAIGSFPLGMNPNQPAPAPTNNATTSFNGFPADMNLNQSAPAPTNNPPIVNINQAQTSPSSTNNAPSSFSKFLPGLGGNKSTSTTTTNDPQTTQTNYPSIMNSPSQFPSTQVPSMNDSNYSTNSQSKPIMKPILSFQNQSHANGDNGDDNGSRLELDFPIENVLADSNIPSAMAIKINETIERDRLGNAYHINRYTIEPPMQRIYIGNDEPITRRLSNNNFHVGTRHITEIENFNPNLLSNNIIDCQRLTGQHHRHHSQSDASLDDYLDQLIRKSGGTVIQAQSFQHLQQLINQYISHYQFMPTQSSTNPPPLDTNNIKEPVFYYTARALPTDPMAHY
ncbi:unnamed protein product [Rotaria socialis]